MATKETKLQIVVDAVNRASGTFDRLGRDLDAVKKATTNVRDGMQAVGAAGSIAFGSLALVTTAAVKAGAGFEQTSLAFETMIGSAEKAQRTLKELSQFAARTPFELTQLEEASKRLLAYGVAADDLIPTLKMLGDISAGVGMDKLPQLILAFGQVRAATKLTGMELRQFSEAGVPLLGTLAEQLGKSESEILEMVSAGEIGFPMVQAALASLTGEGGRFFNLMERQSTSLGGLWSNLKDQIALTARTIGTELLPHLKPLVEQLIQVTKAVGAFVQEHPKLSAVILVSVLALTALMAVLLPLAIALPGLIILFGMLGAAFVAVTAVSAPLLLAIGAVTAGLVLFASQGYLTLEAWQNVWLGIKIIAAEAANAVLDTMEGMLNFIIDGVNKAIRAINNVIAMAQKVPGIGKLIPSLSELNRVEFGGIDTGSIAASDLAGRSSGGVTQNAISIQGVFLSEDVAEKIGDMLIGKLKLSTQL